MTADTRANGARGGRAEGAGPLFDGTGEVRARCRAVDWASTPLGPVEAWPPSLRTSVGIVLGSAFPMVLLWGEALAQVYNDAYSEIMGVKHPAGLGRPTRDCWPEVWHLNAPIYERVRAGETVVLEDALYPISRTGVLEDAWFTLSYGPVPDDAGAIGGVLVTVFETTTQMRARGARELERDELLAESEAARHRITAVLESIDDAFYAVDAGFRFTYVNRRAEALWGRSRESLLGRHYWTEFPQAVGSEPHRRQLAAMADRRPAHFEVMSPIIGRWLDVSLYPDEVGGGLACYFLDVTERKETEARLREAEERYRALFTAIDQGFCTLEVRFDAEDRPVDYRFLEVSPSFERQTGIADGAGRWMRDIAPDQDEHWFERYGRVARTGEPARFEEHSTPLGRWWTVYAFRFGDPTLRRVGVLFEDITDRKRADAERDRLLAELGAERERLRSVILHTPAPLSLLEGPEHRFALVNDAYKRISGGGRDVTGLTPPDAFPELAGSGIYELFDHVYETGEPWDGPESMVRYDRDGTGVRDTWFNLRFEPVRDAEQRVVAILNFAVDVTEQVLARRQVEAHAAALAAKTAELEANQDRLRLALDAVGMAFWDFDPRSNTTVRSPHHDRLYGHDVPLAVWNFDVFLAHLHPDDRSHVAARFARALDHDEEWQVEARVVWPDGSTHWIATQGVVFRDPDGTPSRVLGIITDVTARRQAEAERERLLGEAEIARRDAEAANRAKGEFLAVMSHELRTPLNAIGGYAELIELGIHGPVTDEQRTALDRIQRSQRHLLGRIAGVLDYSRVEAGAVRSHVVDVPVAEAVTEAEALVAPQLRAKGLGYAWSGAPPDLCVRADREKLQQILLNLLGNAVKFTHPRDGEAGRIEVACTIEDASSDEAASSRVRIHVRDTGVGIAAEELERVFEPFVQADQRLTRPHAGVGLGLAISRDLARGMGGELSVESTPGVGSTFTLTLHRA